MRFENMKATFDNVCKKKVTWEGILSGCLHLPPDIDINDGFAMLTVFGFSAASIRDKFGVVKNASSSHKVSVAAFRVDTLASKKSMESNETEHLVALSVHVVHILLFATFSGNNTNFGAEHIYNLAEKMVQFAAGIRFSRHIMYPYGNSFALRDLIAPANDVLHTMSMGPTRSAFAAGNTAAARSSRHRSSHS
jgi:hypothetical protein